MGRSQLNPCKIKTQVTPQLLEKKTCTIPEIQITPETPGLEYEFHFGFRLTGAIEFFFQVSFRQTAYTSNCVITDDSGTLAIPNSEG